MKHRIPAERRKTETIPVRVSPLDLIAMKTSAAARRQRLSTWVRVQFGLTPEPERRYNLHSSDLMGLKLRNACEDPWPGDLWKREGNKAPHGPYLQVRGVVRSTRLRVAFASLEPGEPLFDLAAREWFALCTQYRCVWFAVGRTL